MTLTHPYVLLGSRRAYSERETYANLNSEAYVNYVCNSFILVMLDTWTLSATGLQKFETEAISFYFCFFVSLPVFLVITSYLNFFLFNTIPSIKEGVQHDQIKMTNQVLCKMTNWHFEDD